MLLLSSADFLKKKKVLSGTLSVCQMVWIQIRTDGLSVLVLAWVQTVCNGYQQTTKVAASREELKMLVLLSGYSNCL